MKYLKAYPEVLDHEFLILHCWDFIKDKIECKEVLYGSYAVTDINIVEVDKIKYDIFEEFVRNDSNDFRAVWGTHDMIESLHHDGINIEECAEKFALIPTKVAYILMASLIPEEKLAKDIVHKISKSKTAIQELMRNGVDKYAVLNLLVKNQRSIHCWHSDYLDDARNVAKPYRKAYNFCKLLTSPYDKLTGDLKKLVAFKEEAEHSYSIDGEQYFYEQAYKLECEIIDYAKQFDPYMLKRIAKSMQELEIEKQKFKQNYFDDITRNKTSTSFEITKTPFYKASLELTEISENLIKENTRVK